MESAVQAPSGSNAQGWQFVFVSDKGKREKIGEYYRLAFSHYRHMPFAIHKLHADSADESLATSQERSASSADYLADNMGKAPVLMIPCIAGRIDNAEGANASAQAGTMGSIIPAAWSFMGGPSSSRCRPQAIVHAEEPDHSHGAVICLGHPDHQLAPSRRVKKRDNALNN